MSVFEFIPGSREDAVLPSKAHRNDAGWDLYLSTDGAVELAPMEAKLCPTGVRMVAGAISGGVGLVCPRSGLAAKKGVTVLNAPGVLDQDYTGEILVNLVNLSGDLVVLENGDRIAQVVFTPIMALGDGNTSKDRGECGHGSSGR